MKKRILVIENISEKKEFPEVVIRSQTTGQTIHLQISDSIKVKSNGEIEKIE